MFTYSFSFFFFFFQAEDGIRDATVTGVQTCALPISECAWSSAAAELHAHSALHLGPRVGHEEEQRRHGEHGGDGEEGGALQRRLLLPAAAGRGSGSRNCCCSVDPSIAVTDDTPPVAIWVTSSK